MSETSVARAIQRASGWPYEKCFLWLCAHRAEALEGIGTRAERAVALWRRLETEPIPKPGAAPFPIGRTGLIAQEVIPNAYREVSPPKAADEDHCIICGNTGWDIDTSAQLVPCACIHQKR
jgi:hypothetical protein